MPLDPLFQQVLVLENGTCPVCRHPLGELAEPRCPRCRSGLAVGLAVIEPYVLPWAILLAALAAIAAFGLFLIMIVVIRGEIPRVMNRATMITTMCIGPIMAVAAILVCILRKSFFRLPRPLQRILAFLALAAAIILTVIFSIGR